MQTNNLETLKMLTMAGLGWSLLPKTMRDKSLKALDVGLDLSRELGLVIHSKRSLSNAALALKSLIEQASS
jgi:DNA-binding transcriptional LysR family regulator